MKEWDNKWDRITDDTYWDEDRKMVHQNGGDFLKWTALRSDNGFYVAGLVGTRSGIQNLIIWSPTLVKKYLRLVPKEEL